MSGSLNLILKQIYTFLSLAALCSLSPLFVYIDIRWFQNRMSELSLTEFTQEFFLLVTALVFITSALKYRALRAGLMLAGGFYLVMLIRELDYFFDFIRHGAWLWFALSATAITLAYAWRNRETILPGLLALARHQGFGYTMSGLVCVLVFSRLFGMSEIWKSLLNDGFAYAVKSSIEEGTELLGYSLSLFGACYWRLTVEADESETEKSLAHLHKAPAASQDYSFE